jgi:hypothetical protein
VLKQRLDMKKALAFEGSVLFKTRMLVPGAGLEPARLAAGDFESPTSTNFITRAGCGVLKA